MSLKGAEIAKIHHQDSTSSTDSSKSEEEKKKDEIKSRLLKMKD